MEHVIIRPYEERDREALCRIHDGARPMELARANLSAAFIPLAQAAVAEGLFDYQVDVAQGPDGVVGFVAYTGQEPAWLYVDPARMGRGLGRQLAAHAMARAKGRPLAVEVLAGNTPALALYQSLGFKTVETAFGPMPGNEAFAVTVHCMELR